MKIREDMRMTPKGLLQVVWDAERQAYAPWRWVRTSDLVKILDKYKKAPAENATETYRQVGVVHVYESRSDSFEVDVQVAYPILKKESLWIGCQKFDPKEIAKIRRYLRGR